MEAGDKVFVKNPDRCYTNYAQWIECFTQQYQTQYSFGHKPERNQEYTIVFIAPHLLYTNIKLCLIQGFFGDCYLVDMHALSKYNEEGLEEIED